MTTLKTFQVWLGAARSGPRFALELADQLEAGIAEIYPGEAVTIAAFDAARVIYRLGGGELLASTYELDGDVAIVSASIWPRSNPTPSRGREQAVAELRRQIADLTAGIDKLAAKRSPAGAADADFAPLTAYGPPEPGALPWAPELPPFGGPTPLHQLAAMGVDADFAAINDHPLERPAAAPAAGDDPDYAALPRWELGR